jgi:cyclic dehypoxanthinyl futalosine synthase
MGISREQALECLRSDDLVGMGMEADAVRRRLHPEGVATYVLDSEAEHAPALTGPAGIAEWIAGHRAAHAAGKRTTARMVFGIGMGAGETGAVERLEERADLLEAVRALQEETGGFAAFVPVAAPAANGRQLDSVTAVERLKMLAVARMFLDNIENIQADGVANGIDGLKVLQTALRFGANDLGMVDAGRGRSEEDLRRIIRDAGLRPAERDAAYRAMMLG